MESTGQKLFILQRLANALAQQEITWALGGSAMLYLQGVTDRFADFDLLVAAKDFKKAKAVLRRLGEEKPPKQPVSSGAGLPFRSAHFCQFVVEGVKVDLMAGFALAAGEKVRRFLLLSRHIGFFDLDGTPIALHGLKQWQQFYTLMGRAEKALLIEDFLAKKKASVSSFEKTLTHHL